MSISGVRTAALTLAILVVLTEGASITARLAGLGRSLDKLPTPSVVMLGAVAGLALIACRPTRH